MNTKDRIRELLTKVLANHATAGELEELTELVKTDSSGNNALEIESLLKNETADPPEYSFEASPDNLVDRILLSDKISSNKPARLFSLGRRIAVAASIAVLIGLGAWLWLNNQPAKEADGGNKVAVKNDVRPGGNRAVLTLADGSVVILDNAANGLLTEQGNTKILKTSDGVLAYDFSKNNSSELLYNIVSTPRGGQYQVTLPDGTKVWLNAASSLRFPTAFTGEERRVELTGEAYFEVAHDAAKPFYVNFSGTNDRKGSVQVLGTHFNVMAYNDENETKTTLLEGKVKIMGADDIATLSPGQQAVLKKETLQVVKDIDTGEAIAWKNGYFHFNKIDANALRQVSRWYDIDIVYEAPLKEKSYTAKIERSVNLSNVVDALKEIGINCALQNNKLVIKP